MVRRRPNPAYNRRSGRFGPFGLCLLLVAQDVPLSYSSGLCGFLRTELRRLVYVITKRLFYAYRQSDSKAHHAPHKTTPVPKHSKAIKTALQPKQPNSTAYDVQL
jgi:hypothetical protein